MKLVLKEEPREWRKAAWFGALGFALLSSLLRWRGVLTNQGWATALAVLAFIALVATLKPAWFRGYYRFMARVAFFLVRCFGYVALATFFIFILTPVGLVLRLCGKDLLALTPRRSVESYWKPARPTSRLEDSV